MRRLLLVLAIVAGLVVPTYAASAQAATCTGHLGDVCGAYDYPQSTWSNGFNTYVADQDVGCGGNTSFCNDNLAVTDPGSWSLTSTMSDSATNCNEVHTYPDIQQLTTDSAGNDIVVGQYKSLYSKFAISSPPVGSYEAAYDIWFSNPGQEVMIWVDTQNHDHGETLSGKPTIFGQPFHVYTSGNKSDPGEIIVKLDTNELSGTAHIKAVSNWLIKHGWIPPTETIAQINFGWEVCGTGSQPETFAVSQYSLTGVQSPVTSNK